MNFTVKRGSLEKQPSDCLVIGVFENNQLSDTAEKIDKISHRYLSKLLKKTPDFRGKVCETQFLYQVPGIRANRILLVGCGKNTTVTIQDFRKIMIASIQAIEDAAITKAIDFLTELKIEDRSQSWKIKFSVEIFRDILYSFDHYKTKPGKKSFLKQFIFAVEEKRILTECQKALTQGLAIADGKDLTKDLANTPPNICTPLYLAKQAQALAKAQKHVTTQLIDKTAMKKLGMGAFLAVAQGSVNDPMLVSVSYEGAPKTQKPVVIIGKGITFDTGGINLKPSDGIVGMKYDMCGAATVLGVIKTISELKLPINVIGLMACAENMPSGTASRPEDIVQTLSGQTVEILNTDAEGRLVLCDTLTYAERFKPSTVIDIATLTGAVVIALGHHATGLLSNNDVLAKELLDAGNECYDRAWQLPLWEDYQDQLKSPFADMSNVGGRAGGTITAACFLSRFAKKFRWAHLDVAGTAAMMLGTSDRKATGRPVPLLVQYLINECEK
jgi:leucyl aminopeptidase